MGHLVQCFSYDYGKTEKQRKENIQMINFEANEFARNNSDSHGGLYSSIVFNSNKIFESFDEAAEYLNNQDRSYYQGAVLYKKYEKKQNAKSEKIIKKVDEMSKKIDSEYDAMEEYVRKNNVKNRKSIYVGCTKCGSKLHKDYIRLGSDSQLCPLCGNNLFSDTVQKRIEKYKTDIQAMKKEHKKLMQDSENAKKTGKYELKWCLKLEIHV